ncbi:hypothetical protein ACR71G_12120 [Xenorhabdus bovienii]|uniref:Uncharacterized protein n=1 Tax=Xenorhabdus bovienii str. kraussei Becker Underwood TaxID=1398204 RepID=A0A077PTM0_XENBV|nr:hypothetical protein [Xenorhabdus bovienii]CDH24388.1 hypothetical protein XBKB1_2730003 [Xenorhabdus bovienii str. kraussei Becker Underwood]
MYSIEYYFLMLNISPYQGPSFILGIFETKQLAEQAEKEYSSQMNQEDGVLRETTEIQTIQSHFLLDSIGYIVSRYAEGFGQTYRDSINLYDDKNIAEQERDRLEGLIDFEKISFPEYHIMEEVKLNVLRDIKETGWLSSDYGDGGWSSFTQEDTLYELL